MNVLVVSPHPDDETLGAGGTILRLISEGHSVSWLNITSVSAELGFSKEMIQTRKKQLKQVQEFYKFNEAFHLDFPTTKLEECDSSKAIDKIAGVFRKVEPQCVILPDYNDAHSDHEKVFNWCHACSKIFRFPYIKQIMTMEILSETDFGKPQNPFVPNYYVDITDYMEKKIQAIKVYDTELGIHPFPRSIESIEALATLRGAAAGVKCAEAFRLIKYIV